MGDLISWILLRITAIFVCDFSIKLNDHNGSFIGLSHASEMADHAINTISVNKYIFSYTHVRREFKYFLIKGHLIYHIGFVMITILSRNKCCWGGKKN